MQKKYQIFVSGTYRDLNKERQAVFHAILKDGNIPVGMEYFNAADESQWRIIQNAIDCSDFYVLIIANRYGSIIENGVDKGISYTQKEFRYAKQKKIPILAFLINKNANVRVEQIEQNVTNKRKLERFVNEVKENREVAFWHNADELSLLVSSAIKREIERTQRPGWVRYYSTKKSKNGLYEKLNWDEFYYHLYLLAEALRQSENLGGYKFDLIIGISGGGISSADLLAREFGYCIPVLGLFAYRADHTTRYDHPLCADVNAKIIDAIRNRGTKRILLIDGFLRHGQTILEAKRYLQQNLDSTVMIKTAVIYANNKVCREILDQIDYVMRELPLDGKKLSLAD